MPSPAPASHRSPPELVARFDELAALVPDATRRQMFGYPSLVTGGHMFASLHRADLVLRLAEDDRARFTERYGEHPFEPMPGRPMTGFVVVPPEAVAGDDAESLLLTAYAGAVAMPPKPPKPPKPAKAGGARAR